ncbi:uncharacterized protein LOC128883433 [Hylaeus volcanicus]|uniref:uncharacterized protein LOC128883433 n=1 Tax=Hylaeus volcanicus TaxID=313075 RepID=UPI0023B865B4|nr:uncharacterized protein LOC128883433 [Hylaeus volcanicus]
MTLNQNSQKVSIQDTKQPKHWWHFWKSDSSSDDSLINDKKNDLENKKDSSDITIKVKTKFGCVCMSNILHHWSRGRTYHLQVNMMEPCIEILNAIAARNPKRKECILKCPLVLNRKEFIEKDRLVLLYNINEDSEMEMLMPLWYIVFSDCH